MAKVYSKFRQLPDTHMNAGKLRQIADAVKLNTGAKQLEEAEKQVIEAYECFKAEAEKGHYGVEYKHDLCDLAQEMLKSQGLKIRDDGMGVTSSYYISWEKKEEEDE